MFSSSDIIFAASLRVFSSDTMSLSQTETISSFSEGVFKTSSSGTRPFLSSRVSRRRMAESE
jgi:hypothetical protein